MFMHVIDARHVEAYGVQLSFNDGTTAEVDLKDSLEARSLNPFEMSSISSRFPLLAIHLRGPTVPISHRTTCDRS